LKGKKKKDKNSGFFREDFQKQEKVKETKKDGEI